MKKTSETIVFFGSGPVAAESLRLLSQSFEIEAVITKPHPPHHRGSTPVVELAEQLKLPTVEASNRKELSEKVAAANFSSRVAVLVDFGILVAQDVIDAFPLGIVNSHFSILPEWRGADPITFAILSGQKQTGVSLMLLVEKMDEGPILSQAAYDIAPDETAASLTSNLIDLSYALLCNVLPLYIRDVIEPVPQEIAASMTHTSLKPSYSRRLVKEDGILDWQKHAEVLERQVRAFSGWPKSRTRLAGRDVVITKAHVVKIACTPGQILTRDRSLIVGTAHNGLSIDSIIPAGKKEMTASAFLLGYGKVLGTGNNR
jgi:methionyl-tRNA formyltransferase